MTLILTILGFLKPLAEPLLKVFTHAFAFMAGRRDANLTARAKAAEAAFEMQQKVRHVENAATNDPRQLARRLRDRANTRPGGLPLDR